MCAATPETVRRWIRSGRLPSRRANVGAYRDQIGQLDLEYPDDDPPVLVSIGGGKEPVWSRNGRELFYRNGNQMFGVPSRQHPG